MQVGPLLVMPADAGAALQGATHHHCLVVLKRKLWFGCSVTRNKEEMSERGVHVAGTETKQRRGQMDKGGASVIRRMEEKDGDERLMTNERGLQLRVAFVCAFVP